MTNNVTSTPAAPSDLAERHFSKRLIFETDCWDVWDALRTENPGFVPLDVRSPELFAKGHVSGAVDIPHGKITSSRMEEYPPDTVFVTYCAGPHCNGSTKGALRLARLGRPVKEMIGGITGWIDEGFDLVRG